LPVDDIAVDSAALRERLVAILGEAGRTALATFRGPLKHWIKDKSSPVCEADIAVNDLLHDRLLSATPGFGWLSEETQDDLARTAAPFVWVVDPIDGTRAYIGEREDWSISVALVADGRPILAGLYAPVTEEMFVAAAGQGATCNGEPIAATADADLDGVRVAGPPGLLKTLATLRPGLVPVPKIHSLALRITRVAHGRIDAALASGNSHDWDLAAADLLVHEAGGTITTLRGHLPVYNQREPRHPPLVAAGRERHRGMLELARDGAARLG
jgi:myo-inositol-1(or 4)-monophosphatase